MIILYFDCDDNYGQFDAESGGGGYGNGFTLEQCFQYIEDNGGYEEFDFYSWGGGGDNAKIQSRNCRNI